LAARTAFSGLRPSSRGEGGHPGIGVDLADPDRLLLCRRRQRQRGERDAENESLHRLFLPP
jgi:hypothetical protein